MSSDDLDHGYGDTHRAFLQAIFSRQTITYEDAKPLLASIQTASTPDRPTLPNDISHADFDSYVHSVNNAISRFDLEIRSSLHQASKERIYALVNTSTDAIAQMATRHSADEISFVRRVLDAMFDTYNTARAEVMAVTSMQALKLAKPRLEDREANRAESSAQAQARQGSGLTMAQAERVLTSLVKEGWFELSARGFYSLSPRALMELRGWLIDTYNDQSEDEDEDEEEPPHEKIKLCQACHEIVTLGQRCPNLVCPGRLHNHCVRNMFLAQGGREACAVCKTAWVDAPLVGEMAGKSGGDGGRTSTNWERANNGGRSGRAGNKRRRIGASESDADAGAEV